VEDHGAAVTEHAQWNSYFVDFLQEAPEATGEEADDAELDAPKVHSFVYYSFSILFILYFVFFILLLCCTR